MCGIMGYVGYRTAQEVLIEGLHRNGRVERVHDVGMMVHQFSPLSIGSVLPPGSLRK